MNTLITALSQPRRTTTTDGRPTSPKKMSRLARAATLAALALAIPTSAVLGATIHSGSFGVTILSGATVCYSHVDFNWGYKQLKIEGPTIRNMNTAASARWTVTVEYRTDPTTAWRQWFTTTRAAAPTLPIKTNWQTPSVEQIVDATWRGEVRTYDRIDFLDRYGRIIGTWGPQWEAEYFTDVYRYGYGFQQWPGTCRF